MPLLYRSFAANNKQCPAQICITSFIILKIRSRQDILFDSETKSGKIISILQNFVVDAWGIHTHTRTHTSTHRTAARWLGHPAALTTTQGKGQGKGTIRRGEEEERRSRRMAEKDLQENGREIEGDGVRKTGKDTKEREMGQEQE